MAAEATQGPRSATPPPVEDPNSYFKDFGRMIEKLGCSKFFIGEDNKLYTSSEYSIIRSARRTVGLDANADFGRVSKYFEELTQLFLKEKPSKKTEGVRIKVVKSKEELSRYGINQHNLLVLIDIIQKVSKTCYKETDKFTTVKGEEGFKQERLNEIAGNLTKIASHIYFDKKSLDFDSELQKHSKDKCGYCVPVQSLYA